MAEGKKFNGLLFGHFLLKPLNSLMKNKENMYFETRSEPALQEGLPL